MATVRAHTPREKAGIFAFAFVLLAVIVGGAFAVGYLIGRTFL
jgi:hypothetical protein